MSDQTSTLLIKLLATGDLDALTHGKEKSEALKVSIEGLKKALELLGVGASLDWMVEQTKATIEYGASLKHLSEQAGITTEAFQKLSYAAAGVGLKHEDLSQAMSVLNRNMAQAADGATKQNRAISELGLKTADLLAMPVEQQIEEIARAYVNASDKTKAWADVIALLGKNSARTRELLKEIGEHGLSETGQGLIISKADIERLDHADRFFEKLKLDIKAISAEMVARPLDALLMLGTGMVDPAAFARFHGAGADLKHAGKSHGGVEGELTAAEIQEQMEATIQAMPEMIAAHQALRRALEDEKRAYEGPAEAAKRLNREGQEALDKAKELETDRTDAAKQLEAVKMKTEAMKLFGQANVEEVRAAREKYVYDTAEKEIAERMAQLDTRKLSLAGQIAQAKQHEANLESDLAKLDPQSVTYKQDRLNIEGKILANKAEIVALEERDQNLMVENLARAEEWKNRRAAIGLAAIESDYTQTQAQKWMERRDALNSLIASQERYLAQQRAIAADSSLNRSARDRAANNADRGLGALLGTRQQFDAMGPSPTSFLQTFRADLTRLQDQWGTLQQAMSRGLSGTINTGVTSLSNNLTKVVTGFQTMGQAVRQVATDVGTTLVQALIDMGVQWVATKAMQLAFGTTAKATDTATTVAAAEASSLAWAVPAMLASIASFGAADVAGMVGYSAAIAEAMAVGVTGYERGGLVSGSEQLIRVNERGEEFVWSAPAVRAIGAGNLERAHQAALSGGGGVSAAGAVPGTSGNIILAMSAGDVARSQRTYVDARVYRMAGRIPAARVAL